MHQFDSSAADEVQTGDQHADSFFVYDCPEKPKLSVAVGNMKEGVKSFHASISSLGLNQTQTSRVYKIVNHFARMTSDFYTTSIEENVSAPIEHVLGQATDMVCNHLDERLTAYKRHKLLNTNDFFVKPKEVAIGLRWERRKVRPYGRKYGRQISIPRLIQNTFQFVSIAETLRALFSLKEFEDYYFEHSSMQSHDCDGTKYFDFCCGKTFKSKEFFRDNPNCLKIQLYADEFEVCNPLQSKAGMHKMCGIYFTIRNLPKEFSSKLNNIFFVGLVNSNDLKTGKTDYNNVWHPIVKDLLSLESHGISIREHGVIKGTLTHVCFDNLGANVGLGFAQSFSASYFCRFCLLSKVDCQVTTFNDEAKQRTIEHYDSCIEIAEDSDKVDYDATKGIRNYCDLNDLQNFHIIEHPTCDVMHDLNEGAIPHLLKLVFLHCISIKLFSLDQLRFMFQFHDYGWLNRKNIPSQINIDVRSIGQNASQSIFLFRTVPFILHQFKDEPKLSSQWKCIQLLLKILVIVYSYEIRAEEVNDLEALTRKFLDIMITTFGLPLIPKLHFLLHYALIIRMVGPVVYMNTIRYEAVHQLFKQNAKNTKNFINILKSLALKHQERFCQEKVRCNDEIKCQKRTPIPQEIISQHETLISSLGSLLDDLVQTNSFRCNSYEYRKDLLFVHESFLFKIHHVFCAGQKYFFLSKKYKVNHFDDFLNSFQVERINSSHFVLIDFANLKNKVSYELKFLSGNEYIIEENLEFRHQLCL